MQIVAGVVEPLLGALDMAADLGDHFPEPRRMIHLDQMRHLVRGEIIEHVWRRENEPPGERHGTRRGAGAPAAGLIADRQPLYLDAQRLRIELRRLVQVAANFALQVIVDPALDAALPKFLTASDAVIASATTTR